MAVSQPWYWNENTLEDNTARLQEGLPPHSSRPHHLPLLPHPLLLPQDPLLPPGGQPSSYPCPLKPVSCLLAVKATLLSAIASKSLCPHSDSSLNFPTTMVIRSPYWSSCCRILPPFFKSVGFKDIEYDIPLAHGTWHVLPLNWSPHWTGPPIQLVPTFNWSSHSTGPPIQLVPKYRTIWWQRVSGSSGRHFFIQREEVSADLSRLHTLLLLLTYSPWQCYDATWVSQTARCHRWIRQDKAPSFPSRGINFWLYI